MSVPTATASAALPTADRPTADHPTADRPPVRREPAPHRRAGGAVGALLAALVTALLGMTALAAPASAYQVTSGSAPVLPTIYAVQGAHQNVGSAVTGPMWKPYVYQSGPVVSRTSPGGAQYVSVRYGVDRWTGSAWTSETSQTVSGTIASTATSVQVPALSRYVGGAAWYRVRLSVTWTSPIGAVIGSLGVTMNGTGDYRCSTTQTCSVATNAVYLR